MMNLEEIKEWWDNPHNHYGPVHQIDWLIAEVTALHLANATAYNRGLREAAEVALEMAKDEYTDWNADDIYQAILAKVGQGEECVWPDRKYPPMSPEEFQRQYEGDWTIKAESMCEWQSQNGDRYVTSCGYILGKSVTGVGRCICRLVQGQAPVRVQTLSVQAPNMPTYLHRRVRESL